MTNNGKGKSVGKKALLEAGGIASLILPFPAISITEKLTDFWTRSLDRRVAIYSDRPRNIVVSESRSPRYGDM